MFVVLHALFVKHAHKLYKHKVILPTYKEGKKTDNENVKQVILKIRIIILILRIDGPLGRHTYELCMTYMLLRL